MTPNSPSHNHNTLQYNATTTTTDSDPKILELFSRFGFTYLTEIQSKASPVILQRRDCLAVAPTGSGKTECSVIPIFSTMSSSKGSRGIRALYVTPLRALNRDVFRRITGYAKLCGLDIGIRHGDTPQGQRKKMAENPPDIMITTPETLVVLLSQQKMLDALASLEWVIIDEVHELLASKRGAQLALSLERLELNATRPLTRIGLSATVGNMTEAAKFVAGTRRRCRIIQDRSVRKYDVDIQYVRGTISDTARAIYTRITESKLDSPVLLFANTRGEAEFLASILKEYSSVPVELHHGSLSKSVREETEQALREGSGLRIIVCTSSLELGIDIGSVDLVVHYGSPRQVSKFVQRIGRSRHVQGASARGLIITNSADDELEAKAILKRVSKGSIEQQRIHKNPLDVLAHHMIGLSMQAGPDHIRVDDALGMVQKAYPYRDLSLELFCDVLAELDSSRLIYFDREKMTFVKSGRYMMYHFENLSTIPDILRFKVSDGVGRKTIGMLDQRFVGDYGEQGNVFVLRGSQWRILNVDEKSFVVNVEPAKTAGGTPDSEKTVPYWEGESIPIDFETAQLVGKFHSMIRRGDLKVQSGVYATTATSSIDTSADTISSSSVDHSYESSDTSMMSTLEKESFTQGKSDLVSGQTKPSHTSSDHKISNHINDELVITAESQKLQGIVVLHCYFGSRINTTLSALLSSMLSALTSSHVDSRSDGYRIVLSSRTARISEPMLRRVLCDEYDLESMVGASLVGKHNVNWRVWGAARKFGAIKRDAMYGGKHAQFLYKQYADTPIVQEALRELFHDKYDLEGCRMVLERIRDGEITILWRDIVNFSKGALPILDHTSRYYSSPAALDKEILNSVKVRLEKTAHRIVCMRCGKWERRIETRDVKGTLMCPHCRSRQITVTFHSDLDLPDVVRKRVAGKKITADQRRRFDRAWKVASLVESFGPVAVMVMSGYGVGADTAARILRNMIGDDEDNLIKQIYEAERQYVMTRGFWD